MGGDALTGIEAMGRLAEGLHISSAYLPDRPGERNAQFVAAYGRAYPGQRPDHRGAGAYDIVYLLARALTAGGPHRPPPRGPPAPGARAPAALVGGPGPHSFAPPGAGGGQAGGGEGGRRQA